MARSTLPNANYLHFSPSTFAQKIENYEFKKAKQAQFFRKFAIRASTHASQIDALNNDQLDAALDLFGFHDGDTEDWDIVDKREWLKHNMEFSMDKSLRKEGAEFKKAMEEYNTDERVKSFIDSC